jgi:hypothetical protein
VGGAGRWQRELSLSPLQGFEVAGNSPAVSFWTVCRLSEPTACSVRIWDEVLMRSSTTMDKRLLKAAAYYYGASFGTFDFFNFDDELPEDGYFASYPWRLGLIQRELERLVQFSATPVLESALASFYAPQGPQNSFLALLNRTRDLLGFDEGPQLHLVDSLPGSFVSRDWDAMSIDKNDEQYYKVPAGIYFKKSFLTHCYFEYVIAHELVHWAISQHSDEYFPHASAYEEGLCDFLSLYVLLKSEYLPVEALVNLLVYNRILQTRDKPWYAYWKFCKAWLAAASRTGLQEIVAIARSGRAAVASGLHPRGPVQSVEALDPLIGRLGEVSMEAEAALSIGIDEYLVLQSAVHKRAPGKLTVYDLYADLSMPKANVDSAVNGLVRLNLLSREGNDTLYQASFQMPGNIKFNLDRGGES